MFIKEFLKKYRTEVILCLIFFAVIAFSLPILTTKPRLWHDEGINIEFAKNFLDFGKLDVKVAPEEFSGLTRFFQASGYPLTLPLSLFFKIFGFSPAAARVYMLGWMMLALLTVFVFTKKLAGRKSALIAVALIASFASFHDSGRAVMGEIPGFVFLLWALYFFFWRSAYFLSGIFWGLAIAAKTSVYMSILPAILVLLTLEKENFWKNSLKVFWGMLPLFLLRILFVMPNLFSLVAWKEVIRIFQNPFGGTVSQTGSFLNNLFNLPKSYTILYFSFLIAVIIWEYFKGIKKDPVYKKNFSFVIVYIFFAFLYYLKSPGWLRYLIAADLLIFILLAVALRNLLSESLKKKFIFNFIIFGLIGFQIFHLFTGAKIFYSDSEEAVINLVNTEFNGKTIGVFNVPEIGAFVPADRKYQTYRMMGVPFIGKNPIFYDPAPEVFIIRASEEESGMSVEEKNIFAGKYQFLKTVGRYNIYSRL